MPVTTVDSAVSGDSLLEPWAEGGFLASFFPMGPGRRGVRFMRLKVPQPPETLLTE